VGVAMNKDYKHKKLEIKFWAGFYYLFGLQVVVVGLAARHKRCSLRPAWALSFLFLVFFKKKENSRKKRSMLD
jgi:hypothetical protein